jgi:4-azaleucine resistance transporter AzlC
MRPHMSSTTDSSPRSEFVQGVRAVAPILLGVIPFGMIYGVLAIGAGLSAAAAQAMSVIVFAGSAQFVGAQLFRVATPGVVLVMTTLVVNLRHVLYSASVAPYIRHLGWKWKVLLAYLLTDEAYAVAIMHYTERQGPPAPPNLGGQCAHWYFLGAGLTLWLTWQISTAIGIALGAQIPSAWALDFTLALTFIALVVPALKDRPSVAAALSAGIVAVAAATWPYKLGLMAAALTGITVGLWADMRQSQAPRHERGRIHER